MSSATSTLSRRTFFVRLMEIQDIAFMVIAAIVAMIYHNHLVWGESAFIFEGVFSIQFSLGDIATAAIALFLWYQAFSLLDLYRSRRLSRGFSVVVDVIKATTLGTAIFTVLTLVTHQELFDFRVIIVFWLIGTILGVISRVLMRIALGVIRRNGRNLRFMLVVGTNAQAMEFVETLSSKPELGYKIIGFVDDDVDFSGKIENIGHSIVSDLAGLADFVRNQVVDEVAIFVSIRSNYDRISEVISVCEGQGVTVRLRSDPFTPKQGHSQIDAVGGSSLITIYTGAMQGSQLFVKRIMDVVASFLLLLLLSPVLFVTALLIKLGSSGSVFFVQERVGLNKRRYPMYKFRTMVQDAEKMMHEIEHLNEAEGPVFKIKSDPRITKIGKFLRVTSIDELPQLLNVLKGEMSLVGPRPLPVRDYDGFDSDWHRRRFSTRPGITCLWQVSGRSNISFDQWMELDMRYIDEWSLWLDLKILYRTINVVVRGTGAS